MGTDALSLATRKLIVRETPVAFATYEDSAIEAEREPAWQVVNSSAAHSRTGKGHCGEIRCIAKRQGCSRAGCARRRDLILKNLTGVALSDEALLVTLFFCDTVLNG